jgi:regulator of cell morphogenesis and NO signaling
MYLQPHKIDRTQTVSDIVIRDYRTADVFRKYGIEYCCGGKSPLEKACQAKQLDEATVLAELEAATRDINTSNTLEFNEWHIDFLTDYIINVHHHYLRRALPGVLDYVNRFAEGHRQKYTYLDELEKLVTQLAKSLLPHLDQEEEVIFPYIRQIAHAYYSRESYASLLVRTLRKPVEEIMEHEHEMTGKALRRLRELTNNYTLPPHACVSHKVTFHKLKEIDCDLVQHMHLENNILFPKAIAMEKELLKQKD